MRLCRKRACLYFRGDPAKCLPRSPAGPVRNAINADRPPPRISMHMRDLLPLRVIRRRAVGVRANGRLMRERREGAPFEHRGKTNRCEVLPPPAPTPPSPGLPGEGDKGRLLPGIPQCWLLSRISGHARRKRVRPELGPRRRPCGAGSGPAPTCLMRRKALPAPVPKNAVSKARAAQARTPHPRTSATLIGGWVKRGTFPQRLML
jgi:hypothetical protein